MMPTVAIHHTAHERRMLFSECVPHARAGFVQSTRLHLAQASCRHRFLAFWLSFSPLSHKTYGELLYSLLPCLQLCASLLTHRLFQRTSTFAAPLRGSVCACSHEPGAGLRRPLLCCSMFLLSCRCSMPNFELGCSVADDFSHEVVKKCFPLPREPHF